MVSGERREVSPQRSQYAKTRVDRAREIEGICQRLKECREARGLSQSEMANLLGIREARYASWETRTAVPVAYLAQICLALGVPAWYLLTGQKRSPEWFNEWFRKQGYTIKPPGDGGHGGGGGSTLSNTPETKMSA
jgi:DNA-binding XRE family transcriptional regulator